MLLFILKKADYAAPQKELPNINEKSSANCWSRFSKISNFQTNTLLIYFFREA